MGRQASDGSACSRRQALETVEPHAGPTSAPRLTRELETDSVTPTGYCTGVPERATVACHARGTATGGAMTSMINIRRQRTGSTATAASVTGAMAVGARILGPSAMGPLAVAVIAVGAMAVGRLAIADAVIRRVRAAEIEIGSLKVRELEVAGQRWTGSTISSIPGADQQS